ncbi:SHOCT domain-containing protein [Candidatus Saccharibacteria bacterium]|nr:SHOCT domain-containing protein [Calditrichia bacterium]NIV72839.1 SHOCT domain-containing protein [Calditrichia bacterium]NIW00019.1 SHOCT domain-containing protein [Candidatus Saccharibacteria bacterium]NIW80389.1 SHOCT domain-containing protein [Calditrichia bacterium]
MMNGWGGMWFGWIFWIIILGLIVWAVVKIVNHNTNRRGAVESPSSGESALDILKKRYARGEIDQQQFQQMKKEIQD